MRTSLDAASRRAATPWLAGMLVVASAALLSASPVLADEWFEESHPYNFDFYAPTPGSMFEYNMDLPLFDTAGGTRELLKITVEYTMSWDYTYTVHPNLTENWLGCDTSWSFMWTSTRDGQPWFPLNLPDTHRYLDGAGGTGAICAPGFAGDGPNEQVGWGYGYTDTLVAADMLAQFSGDGILTVACTHALSDLVVASPDDRRWPPQAPVDQRVFDPTLIDLTIDRIGMSVNVTYFWIPEPSTFLLTALGALALIRRR